jgi:hypothetical protein
LSSGTKVEVLVVTSAACHLCEQAKDVLERLSYVYPLQWQELDITSPEGSSIVRDSRAPFPPVVVIEGRTFGHGRLSEKRFRRHLDQLMKET